MSKRVGGKVCWIPATEINKIAPELETSDFKDVVPFYDVLEEHLMNQGFVLFDDPIEFVGEVVDRGHLELRYNCIVVRGTRRSGRFIVNEIGINFKHIK